MLCKWFYVHDPPFLSNGNNRDCMLYTQVYSSSLKTIIKEKKVCRCKAL